MMALLLYMASIGVIGFVSYVWLLQHVPKLPWPKPSSGGATSGSTSAAPSLPKRPAELQAKVDQQKKQQQQQAAAAAATAATTNSSSNNHKPEEKAAGKDPKAAAKSANLLSMAMHSAPAVPKRPMLNILHAPTLTKSFSPTHSSSGILASPSPSPSTGDSSQAKSDAHRAQVEWELVASEEKYIQCLNILMAVYFNPLKAKVAKGSAKLTESDFHLLFSNVESIWKFHLMFLPALKTAKDSDVASVIGAHADYLKMYTKFVADYSPALQTINKLNRNADFVRFLKKQRESPASEGMDIMSYLIMPVQRVPRYLLLLKELQRHTPAAHPHAASIESAIGKIGNIAKHINETQRQHENASVLLEFQHQIHNLPEEIHLMEPHRRLMRHGILKLLKQEGTASTGALQTTDYERNCVAILFNDMIVYTTLEHDFRGWLKLQACTLKSDNLVLELVQPKTQVHRVQKTLKLECPSLDEADKWTASIQESIQAANELTLSDERRRSAASNSISR